MQGMKNKIYPNGMISRLTQYMKCIVQLRETGKITVTSKEISAGTKINSAEVRRDLIYFGVKGKRGVGFSINDLLNSFDKVLGCGVKKVRMVLAGAGNLGKAILNYKMLDKFGFKVEHVFDNNPKIIGSIISDHKILGISYIKETIKGENTNIAILAVPSRSAQNVTDMLVDAGIKVIINYTSVLVKVPPHVNVQTNDPIEKLLHTLYYLSRTGYAEYK